MQLLLEGMGSECLIERAMRLCGPYAEWAADTPAMMIDVREGRASKTPKRDPDALALSLEETGIRRLRAGAPPTRRHVRAVGDRDQLRPFVRGTAARVRAQVEGRQGPAAGVLLDGPRQTALPHERAACWTVS
jgi:hypothetical protein